MWKTLDIYFQLINISHIQVQEPYIWDVQNDTFLATGNETDEASVGGGHCQTQPGSVHSPVLDDEICSFHFTGFYDHSFSRF